VGIRLFVALILVAVPHANAAFSAYVNVTPETQVDHVKALRIEEQPEGKFLIRVPEDGSLKHVWLIICKTELGESEKNFREYIWSIGDGRRSVEVLAKLGRGIEYPGPGVEERDKNRYIELILAREIMARAYIYIDFPQMVLDGGFYYSIDLPEFLRRVDAR
jgi:hypothetical protein